jgi:hypothetical protein
VKLAFGTILIFAGLTTAFAGPPPSVAAFEATAEGFVHRGAGFEVVLRLDGVEIRREGSADLRISYAPPGTRFEGITPLGESHYRAIRQGPLLWIASASGVFWSWIGDHAAARWTVTGAGAPALDDDGGAVFPSAAGSVILSSRGSRFRIIGDDADIDLGPDPGELVIASTPSEPRQDEATSVGCPGTINFDGGGGTSLWTTGANWDLDRLPEPLDDVCIGAGWSVLLLSGTQNVQSLMVAAGSTLTIAGGALKLEALSRADGNVTLSAGTLTGAGDLDVYGLLTWNGGTMSGTSTTRAHGNLSIGGSAAKVLHQRFLVSNATATWSGSGNITISEFSSITNNGTWNATSDAQITRLLPGGPFHNAGTFRKSGGTGTTTVLVEFNSSGTVDAQAGTLSLEHEGFSTGTFTGTSAGTLRFHDHGFIQWLSTTSSVITPNVTFSLGPVHIEGIFAPSSRTTFTGDGRPYFRPASTLMSLGGDVVLSGGIPLFESGDTITIPSFAFSAGTLDGSDSFRVTDAFAWTGGGLSTTGVVEALGPMEISGSAFRAITGGTLRTSGTVTWTDAASMRLDGNSRIENQGIWDVQGSGTITQQGAGGMFSNGATLRKTGSGTATVSIPFTSSGSVEAVGGTLSFSTMFRQLAGTTTLSGGTLAGTVPIELQAGTLRGTGTVNASISNSGGTVSPGLSPGTLGASGGYTQQAFGGLAVEIGGPAPGTGYDRLDVAGTATLGGSLDVALVNGFTPAAGDAFSIVNAATRTGTFASTSLPPLQAPLAWNVVYTPTAVRLDVAAPSGRIPGDLAGEPPMTVGKSGGSVTLAWASGCVAGDVDSEIYEGVVGTFTSHVPIACSTGGATSWTFLPGAGNRYFLVVPTGAGAEGSYGSAAGGAERPVSASACRPQLVASCP